MQVQLDFVRSLPGDPTALSVQPGRWQRWHVDIPLLILLLVISAYGLLVLYSASGNDMGRVARQLIYLTISFGGMFIVAQFRMKTVKALAPLGYIGGIVLLVLVILMGVDANGAQRWLDVMGLVRFQPSELMKIVVPLTLARYFADVVLPPNPSHLLVGVAMVMAPSVLIIMQPDLGTSILIAASGFLVLWFAGIQWRYLIGGSLLAVASAIPAWQFLLHGYQKQRILTLFNPESDRLGAGWNIIQSKTAIGSGGLDGKGWLNGTQSHLDFLPESHTDFIIAVLAEEFGLVGVLLLLSLYLLVIIRGSQISLLAKDSFSRMVAGSITLTFFIYVVVNMGMVAGMLPVVGVPLPLVSFGGTSLVTMLAGFGILMRIATSNEPS